jgi:hypothetical protein
LDANDPSIEERDTWYLATLGREALLRHLAPLGIPSSVTHDPLDCARWIVRAAPGSRHDVRRAADAALLPLTGAESFSVSLDVEGEAVEHLGIVPVIGEHSAGTVTGQYAEVLLFERGGLMNRAAFRLSRLSGEKHWIIDTSFQPSGVTQAERPFGSGRGGRKRTVPAPVAAELDRLAAQAGWGRK